MNKNKLSSQLRNAFTPDNEVNTFKYLLNCSKCSQATLRRKIKQIGLLVSYNFNLANQFAKLDINEIELPFEKHELDLAVPQKIKNTLKNFTPLECLEKLKCG